MEVLIVGSGIGGLACALALRRQGHRVTLFEQSQLNQETGAAIFLPPNANGLLREYGFVPEQHGANLCLGWRQYSSEGALEVDETFSVNEYPTPWQMIHRQKLHEGLKALAEDSSGPGLPATIVKSSRVVYVDTDRALIHLENGNDIRGDAIIGADGIYSNTRAAVQQKHGVEHKPFSSGSNCFRFLIPRETLLADPETKQTFEALDSLSVWVGEDKKLVCYPCDDNVTMNFVAIHPVELSSATANNDWHSRGSKSALTSIYSTFCPEVRAILEHADPEQIRLYPLMDMKPLPGWTSGSVALLGDAAHPFLPYLAQGGAQAIEDAMSVGVVLPAGTKASDVPGRLALYELARKERAHHIQAATRTSGLKRSELEKAAFDPKAEREYQFRHNELEHSRELLLNHVGNLKA